MTWFGVKAVSVMVEVVMAIYVLFTFLAKTDAFSAFTSSVSKLMVMTGPSELVVEPLVNM